VTFILIITKRLTTKRGDHMSRIKTILLAAAVLLPVAGVARAADYTPPAEQVDATTMGMYLRGDLGASWLRSKGYSKDNAFALSGGVGYQYTDYLRGELAVDWSGKYKVAPGAKLSTTAVMGNVYFDVKNDSMFTPYVGAGLGYGWVRGSGVNKDSGLAFGANAGVSVDLTSNLAVDVGYRFRDIAVKGPDPREHQIMTGIRFKF
jgi:opacity protein-like surface antigen